MVDHLDEKPKLLCAIRATTLFIAILNGKRLRLNFLPRLVTSIVKYRQDIANSESKTHFFDCSGSLCSLCFSDYSWTSYSYGYPLISHLISRILQWNEDAKKFEI